MIAGPLRLLRDLAGWLGSLLVAAVAEVWSAGVLEARDRWRRWRAR